MAGLVVSAISLHRLRANMFPSLGRALDLQHVPWRGLAFASLPLIYIGLLHRSYSVASIYKHSRKVSPPTEPAPYPADKFLWGARDVDTPYGSIRVYEFGDPEAKRRVLFVHGISTPCFSLASIAHQLVDNGCRVMLMDLFGRGYSEAPDPEQVRYDGRLYASQILSAVTSSPISWTGSGRGFTLVGYSLGGGIAADFASYFPKLVDDLVLIAPGGLQRRHHVSLRSKILYSRGWLPEALLQWLVRRRMTTASPSDAAQNNGAASNGGDMDPAKLAVTNPQPNEHGIYESKLSSAPTTADVAAAVDWQIKYHPGFIPAFMSSLRYAPIHGQHARWALIGQRLQRQRDNVDMAALTRHGASANLSEGQQGIAACGFRSGKVHIILGRQDSIVLADEVVEDAEASLGRENVEFTIVPDAGHEVPVTHSQQCARRMIEIWLRGGTTRHER